MTHVSPPPSHAVKEIFSGIPTDFIQSWQKTPGRRSLRSGDTQRAGASFSCTYTNGRTGKATNSSAPCDRLFYHTSHVMKNA